MYLSEYTFTDLSLQVIRLAQQLADEHKQPTYGGAHLLWAVAKEDIGLYPLFKDTDTDPGDLRKWARTQVQGSDKTSRYVELPPADEVATAVFKETNKLCIRYGSPEIDPIDILEALVTPGVAFESDRVRRMPLALYEVIEWRNSHYLPNTSSLNGASGGQATPAAAAQGKTLAGGDVLGRYCTDITALAREDKLDPLIGRDRELKQLVEILGKRLSPNVMLVGEPGVGKTAMVSGLAMAILAGNVPERLADASIFELDVSGRLAAGAFKGEVEERLKTVLKAIKDHGGKAILFIDEVHVLLDERGPVGSGVVNLLKPELARGELTVIGATTQTEYQKHIEKDTAFDRRFTKLTIMEPDELTATVMLGGLMPKYEEFHELRVTEDAIATAVKLAKRYVRDKYLPVSAIELVDFTMACANQMNSTSPKILTELAEKHASEPGSREAFVRDMRNKLSELLVGHLGGEEEIAERTVPDMLYQLTELTERPKETIEAEDIEAIVAYRTNIPLGKLKSSDRSKFGNIEETLRKRVVGQDHVIESVTQALKTFRAGLKDPKEPGAIFFFTGPTGTGKTEMAKAIAELLFDDEDAMIRFDMSEFQEGHSVASLLGSPPGYVGFDQGGLLVNKVRKQPYSVVLFDEIEKAHPDIYGIFLQMLTDSRLQDKQGKMADFSNTIIVFTSNAGAHEVIRYFERGDRPTSEQLKEILRSTKAFKDEFLGRVDSQIIPFGPLTHDVAERILGIHLRKFQRLLRGQHGIELEVGPEAVEYLIEVGFSPLYGARPLKNAIKTYLTPTLADKLLRGELQTGDRVLLGRGAEGNFTWKIDRAESIAIT